MKFQRIFSCWKILTFLNRCNISNIKPIYLFRGVLWFPSICNYGTIWYYINKIKLILRSDSTSANILVDSEVE